MPKKPRSRTPNGHFILRGVAPGDYKVFAWEALEDYALRPGLLEAV